MRPVKALPSRGTAAKEQFSIDRNAGEFHHLAPFLGLVATSLPNSAGVIGFGRPPTSASRATSLGSFSASPMALLRVATISGGVPFGAEMP